MNPRRFAYVEQGPSDEPVLVIMTEAEILATYFPWWQAQMRRVGRAALISPAFCLEDWVVVFWAWELPGPDHELPP